MLFVQEVNHSNVQGYIGTPPLALLKANIRLSLPSDLEQIQRRLEKEDKVIDEISNFVEDSLSNDPWPLGCIVIALYYRQLEQEPTFRPFRQQEGGREIPLYGTLELSDSVVWVPVDGLNRLLGMFRVLSRITDYQRREKLAQNPVPVLFLPISDVEQLQKLIIRMHKSARMVTRGETIRTAVEDRYSLYAGWLKGDDEPVHLGVIPERLVNWKSNTITNRLRQFTTLSTLYDSSKILDQAFGELSSPTPEQINERYRQIRGTWELLLKFLSEEPFLFGKALSGFPDQLPKLRKEFLCMRPTGQLIMINVMAFAIKAFSLKESELLSEVVDRLKEVPWEMNNQLWQDVIIVEGRVNGRSAAIRMAARLVAYLIYIPLNDNEIDILKSGYRAAGKGELPSRIVKKELRLPESERFEL
jgi:hypothetical protein